MSSIHSRKSSQDESCGAVTPQQNPGLEKRSTQVRVCEDGSNNGQKRRIRVHHIESASEKVHGTDIERGDSHYWWRFRNGTKYYSKKFPTNIELSESFRKDDLEIHWEQLTGRLSKPYGKQDEHGSLALSMQTEMDEIACFLKLPQLPNQHWRREYLESRYAMTKALLSLELTMQRWANAQAHTRRANRGALLRLPAVIRKAEEANTSVSACAIAGVCALVFKHVEDARHTHLGILSRTETSQRAEPATHQ